MQAKGYISGKIWKSPISYEDPNNSWTDEENVYDRDTGTHAETWIVSNDWSGFLELDVPKKMYHFIRFWISSKYSLGEDVLYVDLDVYNGKNWIDVFEGVVDETLLDWIEKDFSETRVEKTRLRVRISEVTGGERFFILLHELQIGKLWKGIGHTKGNI